MNKIILTLICVLFSCNAFAQDITVRFAAWAGNENINSWIDGYVHDELKKRYDINLIRVPINDAQDVVQKLIRDKRFDREEGAVDLLWVNGENFKVMKENGLTIAPFLSDRENSKYVDLTSPTIANDFGTKHEGREMPWGSAQMVFIYDQAKINSPPKTLEELERWIKENPGKFTYSAPPDFTGSAFIRQTLLNILGKEKYNDLVKNASEENLKAELPKLWPFLREISPFLYRQGEFYPETVSKIHQLYSDGTIWMTMDYYPTTGERMKNNGIFPSTTNTFVLENGALANTHYITVPFNAPNQSAAKIVANFLL
ncbi:MAG: ABC transporter substrate-binding protein, partial [Emcibacteraceae bacterium]|nr:ABC transporter substrate-binding protein [Emcibacteraceae bacterium]